MKIIPQLFFNHLLEENLNFFTGVPDSLLKELCLCIDETLSRDKHIITANEGNAIALATGYHLATSKIPVVYMQNSGLGNAINPLLSLCDSEVYSIPMLLLIGWRGEPNTKDEPQHIKQGRIQEELLKTLEIPYDCISSVDINYKKKISSLVNRAKNDSKPVALLVSKGIFEKHDKQKIKTSKGMLREDALKIILNELGDNSIIVSTTGKTSREIFEIRDQNKESHEQDFLTVGSMGHCSSIALGIALSKPKNRTVCVDGDGAMIMHMGSLTSIAELKPNNFMHILINNEVHESVGGQDTSAKFINLAEIAGNLGYEKIAVADNPSELKAIINKVKNFKGPSFLEVKVTAGSRDNLSRPTNSPLKNKRLFTKFINSL